MDAQAQASNWIKNPCCVFVRLNTLTAVIDKRCFHQNFLLQKCLDYIKVIHVNNEKKTLEIDAHEVIWRWSNEVLYMWGGMYAQILRLRYFVEKRCSSVSTWVINLLSSHNCPVLKNMCVYSLSPINIEDNFSCDATINKSGKSFLVLKRRNSNFEVMFPL